MIERLPVTSLFSRLVPSGIVILFPSLATMMQVPARRTLAKRDVTRDSQVVELSDVGDRLESLLKVLRGSDSVCGTI
jgi:hypothetical protein